MQGVVEFLMSSIMKIHLGIFQWKIFCKPVKIWQNYSHEFVASLFGRTLYIAEFMYICRTKLERLHNVTDSRVRWKVQISGEMHAKT